MKNRKRWFSIKTKKDGAIICSADGKIQYALVKKIEGGNIIRVFVHEPICDGMLAEGTGTKDMDEAVISTLKKIKTGLKKVR